MFGGGAGEREMGLILANTIRSEPTKFRKVSLCRFSFPKGNFLNRLNVSKFGVLNFLHFGA